MYKKLIKALILPFSFFAFIFLIIPVNQYISKINKIFHSKFNTYEINSLKQVFEIFIQDKMYLIIILVLYLAFILIILAIYAFKNRNNIKHKKEINFKEDDKTHGSGKFMNEEQMHEVLEIGKDAKGILVGKYNGQKVTLKPKDSGNNNLLVVGPTGSGKTTCCVLNNIFQHIEENASMIITDPKLEIYSATNELLKQNGYVVKILNLTDMTHSDRFNALEEIDNVTDAKIATDVIISNTEDSNKTGDAFWMKGEQNLLKALILYMMEDVIERESRNLPNLYAKIASEDVNKIDEIFTHIENDSAAKQAYNIYAKSLPAVKSSIVTGLGVRLQVYQDKLVRALSEKNDIDLSLPAYKKCCYIIVTSDTNDSFDFLRSAYSIVFYLLS